jgi:dCTP deaminase
VRSLDIPFVLEDGQMIGRLVYEPLAHTPDVLYGSDLKSHYQGQALKLSKHFK